MTAPVLACDGVAVGHGSRSVLRGVTFEVQPGEVVALEGRNGSGKTTLLYALAGLRPVREGRIVWSGRAELPRGLERARLLGLVLQSEPAPWLCVREVLRLGGATETRVAEVLHAHRLDPLAHRRVSELSGGERQRVALARACAADPRLYLLDEPTSHLDQVEREEFGAWLAQVRANAGVLIVSHSRSILGLADRRLTVADGRVQVAT